MPPHSLLRHPLRAHFPQALTKPRSSIPTRPYSSFSSSPSKPSARIDRLLLRLPRFLHPYTSGLRNAPVSHITAFLILHEITAIVPLIGLAGTFHYTNWLPEVWVQGAWVREGVERFGRYFGRKGWFGFESASARDVSGLKEGEVEGMQDVKQQVENKYNAGEAGTRILVEVATAYAITKVFLPCRILLSVWGTPWFARVFVGRFTGLFGRRASGIGGGKVRGEIGKRSAAAGTGATGGGVVGTTVGAVGGKKVP